MGWDRVVHPARLVADLSAGWWDLTIRRGFFTWLDTQVSENSADEWRQLVESRGVVAAARMEAIDTIDTVHHHPAQADEAHAQVSPVRATTLWRRGLVEIKKRSWGG